MKSLASNCLFLMVFVIGDKAWSSDEIDLLAEIQAVRTEMESLTHNKQCGSDAECASIPFGSRACGGPSDYLVYSLSIGKEHQRHLQALSARSRELSAKLNERRSLMSHCQVLPEPATVCDEQVCRIDERHQKAQPGQG